MRDSLKSREELLNELEIKDEKIKELGERLKKWEKAGADWKKAFKDEAVPKIKEGNKAQRRREEAKGKRDAIMAEVKARQSISDSVIDGAKRELTSGNGEEIKVHTLVSASLELSKKNIRWRIIEARACNSMFPQGMTLFGQQPVIRNLSVRVAPYDDPIDWNAHGVIKFSRSVEGSGVWRCLLCEDVDGAEVLWVPPRVLTVGGSVIKGEDCLLLAELGEHGRVVSDEPIELLSRVLCCEVSMRDEDGNFFEPIFSDYPEFRKELHKDTVHKKLREKLHEYGLFDRDILYEDSWPRGLKNFDFRDLFEAETLLDGTGLLSDDDPRKLWEDVSLLMKSIKVSADDTERTGMRVDELITQARKSIEYLELYQYFRVDAQELTWIAYCAGMRRAEVVLESMKASAQLGEKFKTKKRSVNPAGRFPHTQIIKKWILQYRDKEGKWPSPKKFQIYAEQNMPEEEYDEVKIHLKKRNVVKGAVDSLKKKHR